MGPKESVPLLPNQFTEWYDFAPGTPKKVEMVSRPTTTTTTTKRRRLSTKTTVEEPTALVAVPTSPVAAPSSPAAEPTDPVVGSTAPVVGPTAPVAGRKAPGELTAEMRKNLRDTGRGCPKCRWKGYCAGCKSTRERVAAQATADVARNDVRGRGPWGHARQSLAPVDLDAEEIEES